jgi:hypothetical protein
MSYALVAGSMFVGPFESEEDAVAHLSDYGAAYDGISTTVVKLVDPDERAEVAANAEPVAVDEPNEGDSTAVSEANVDEYEDE